MAQTIIFAKTDSDFCRALIYSDTSIPVVVTKVETEETNEGFYTCITIEYEEASDLIFFGRLVEMRICEARIKTLHENL